MKRYHVGEKKETFHLATKWSDICKLVTQMLMGIFLPWHHSPWEKIPGKSMGQSPLVIEFISMKLCKTVQISKAHGLFTIFFFTCLQEGKSCKKNYNGRMTSIN